MAQQPEGASDATEVAASLRPASLQTCPDCGSTDTRLSRKEGLLILLLRKFSMRRYKCRTCGKRFFSGI